MKLSHEFGKIFEEKFEEIFQREQKEKDFLKQEDFATCEERANEAIDMAVYTIRKMLTAAIANHRIKDHGEKREAELESALDGLSAEKVEIATRGWWVA